MAIAYQKLKVHRYPNIKMPNVISLIPIGHKVYLAISITKRANYLEMNGNYKFQAAMVQCDADYRNHTYHLTRKNCKEQAYTQIYFKVNLNQSLAKVKV